MSTILKALRRLEQEKTRADRPLREQVTGPDREGPDEGSPPRRWPILLGGIGAGIGAGLAVLYLLVGRGDSAEEAVADASSVAAVSPQAPPARRAMRPAAPAPRPAPPRSEPATAADLEALDEVAVIDRGAPPPRIAEETAPAPIPAPAEPPPGSVRPFQHADPRDLPRRHALPQETPGGVVPEARATAPPALPPRPAVAPIPVPPAPETAQAEPVREADPELAPAPKTPPPEARPAPPKPAPPKPRAPAPPKPPAAALPAVEHTTWHPIAERRVAVVELAGGGTQSVHEGELVAGALVKRIEPSGVVFEQAGREVRRKVGE